MLKYGERERDSERGREGGNIFCLSDTTRWRKDLRMLSVLSETFFFLLLAHPTQLALNRGCENARTHNTTKKYITQTREETLTHAFTVWPWRFARRNQTKRGRRVGNVTLSSLVFTYWVLPVAFSLVFFISNFFFLSFSFFMCSFWGLACYSQRTQAVFACSNSRNVMRAREWEKEETCLLVCLQMSFCLDHFERVEKAIFICHYFKLPRQQKLAPSCFFFETT